MLVQHADADRLVEGIPALDSPLMQLRLDTPDDHYTFAGEIPWSEAFGRSAFEGSAPYRVVMAAASGPDIGVEILAHTYAWESYHSLLNLAGGALVPSRSFSAAFDLRGVPQSFDQVEPHGKWAAKSYSAPTGFDGRLLYLREDLLSRYAAGHRLVWWIWGERWIARQTETRSDQLDEIYKHRQGEWRIARRGDEICRVLR
jgi:hypothetical protein